MAANPTLYCPIRGQLKIKAKTKDGLKFSEEKRRIDCIKHLLDKGYHPSRFKIESTLIRFGHAGRNSFRTDIVVFDIAASIADTLSLEEQREHIIILAEIKRDNKDAAKAKETQVKPALGFLSNLKAVAIYWDDIEQRIFYRKVKGVRQQIIEAPITYLPRHGENINVTKLRYNDLETSPDLLEIFRKIEDEIHPFISDVSIRYELLLQLLLVKIHDESANRYTNGELTIQDFTLFEFAEDEIESIFRRVLEQSLTIYQKYLPRKVSEKIEIPGSALRSVSKHLAPINLLDSSPEVIQSFYMYFAKQLYKWDLAQYFTPYEVVDFIVRLSNPRYGDTIKDPACGSADFLISAHRRSATFDPRIGDKIFGSDNSLNAVQISVLNMLLNGDGKSNITHEDSLENLKKYENLYSLMLCNPPFGVRILEKRKDVLANFDLGKNLSSQQTGILFAELCVRQAQPNGRIAIILPNGYLGNKSATYTLLRHWLLCHTKIVCVVGFPRFTFKKSGADVSASVVVMEKRAKPLSEPEETSDYPVYINLLESVGWEIGNKKARRIFKQDLANGAFLLNDDNEPILDADFNEVLSDLYASPVIHAFSWIVEGIDNASVEDGWSISIRDIVDEPNFSLDPKRHCRKFRELQEHLRQKEHKSLLELCDLIPQGWTGKRNSNIYKYVEIGNVFDNGYEYVELRGWQLPSRAKHRAESGDIFIGSVWGSVKKWFVAGEEARSENLIVTNGFHRLQMKPNMKSWLPDLIFALSSEFYQVQMRALATGSDGLSEVSEDDLGKVLIPQLIDQTVRAEMQKYIAQFIEGEGSLTHLVNKAISKKYPDLDVPSRKTNFSQV